jgi:hypothetical protein
VLFRSLNFTNITIAASRSSGALGFAEGLVNPTLKIRGNNGTSALTTWSMGSLDNFTNNVWTSTADFSIGTLDALVTTLNLGRVNNRFGTINSNFLMGAGSLTVTNINIAVAAGTNTGSPTSVRVANSTFTLAGSGTVTASNVRIADNTAATGTGSATANGSLVVKNGVFNAGSNGIIMASATNTGYAAHGTLDIQGGTVSSGGDLVRSTTGAGTTTATLLLRGGTLNMNGHVIGTTSLPFQTLTLQSGALQNIGQINGGAAITKSGASSDVLRLLGTNTHTGEIGRASCRERVS